MTYDKFFELVRYTSGRGYVLTDDEEYVLERIVRRDGMFAPLRMLAEYDVDSVLLVVQDELRGVEYTPMTIDSLVDTFRRQERRDRFQKSESDRYLFRLSRKLWVVLAPML